MEHILDLASKAFIGAICPTLSSYKKKKKGLKRAGPTEDEFEEDNKENDDDEITWLADLCNLGPALEDEIDDVVDCEPNDLLGKVLALMNQVIYYIKLHLL